MSMFSYNGVRFLFPKTAAVRFGTKRDKVGGVDVVGNTTTIALAGVASLESTIPGNSAAVLAEIRHRLAMPRRSLIYAVGGHTIINWQPGDGRPDADLGPRPNKAVVSQVTPGTFFLDVEYTVTTYDCGDKSLTDPVVSLRWTQSESFDKSHVSTIRTAGTLTVRSDLLQCADNFRSLATPPILSDYRRVDARYTLNPTGTELDFEFVDVEQSLLPPYPAIEADGDYGVDCPNSRRDAYIKVTLKGAKGTSRKDLMAVAIRMCFAKLRSEGFSDGIPLVGGTFSEKLFEPSVTVMMRAKLRPLNSGGFASGAKGDSLPGTPGAPAVMPSVGTTPYVTEGRPGIAPPVRKRLIGLVAAAFRDPCSINEMEVELRNARGDSGPNAELTTGASPPTVSIGETNLATGGESNYKDEAPYDTYTITSAWAYETGRRVLPGTGTGVNGGKGAAVTVHGGLMTLEVDWHAQRTGRPPVLPTFQTDDPNFVPLRSSIVPAAPETSADGTMLVYRVAGHYSYGVLDPSIVAVLAPMPPFLSDTLSEASLTAAGYFSDDVLWKMKTGGSNPLVPGGTVLKTDPPAPPPAAPLPPWTGVGEATGGGGGTGPGNIVGGIIDGLLGWSGPPNA